MHTVDQEDIATAAKLLGQLYAELDTYKYLKPRGTSERPPQSFGPSDPCGWAMTLDEELTRELRPIMVTAAAQIPLHAQSGYDGNQLCHWIRWNAGDLATVDAAQDLLDVLLDQAHTLTRTLEPRRAVPQPPRQEPRLPATTIVRKLQRKGHHVTIDTVRGWARHGHITTTPLPNGHAGYLLTQCLDHLTKNAQL